MLFQRAKIQVKCKQFTTGDVISTYEAGCFKEQRYKLNASNSQQKCNERKKMQVVSKSKDTS